MKCKDNYFIFLMFIFHIITVQIWMTENLNVNTYLNGHIIPYANSRKQMVEFQEQMIGAWCYEDFDKANAKQFG